jgi:hypothetical protein
VVCLFLGLFYLFGCWVFISAAVCFYCCSHVFAFPLFCFLFCGL